jgi:hypothetical protein
MNITSLLAAIWLLFAMMIGPAQPMSAFGGKADIGRRWVNVRF